jgi:hypothetical protein
MPPSVSVSTNNLGSAQASGEIRGAVKSYLSTRPGDSKVSILGAQDNDTWQLKVLYGGSERIVSLYAGEHSVDGVLAALKKIVG